MHSTRSSSNNDRSSSSSNSDATHVRHDRHDDNDNENEDNRAVTKSTTATMMPYRIPVVDYSDRERLLCHITALSTQLQRAQLQVQTHERSLLVLRAALKAQSQQRHNNNNNNDNNNHDDDNNNDNKHRGMYNNDDDDDTAVTLHSSSSLHNNHNANNNGHRADAPAAYVTLRVCAHDATAAVLAADEEAQLHAQWRSRLALFDPQLAQTQIHRLDGALAQLALLREAELQQLRHAERELTALRAQHTHVVRDAAQLRTRCDALEQQQAQQQDALTAAQLELTRLRGEEQRLVTRLTTLQSLRDDDAVALRHTATTTMTAQSLHSQPQRQQRDVDDDSHALWLQAMCARQALWLSMYYEPMLIAFDAGLTWLSETTQLQQQQQQQQQQERVTQTKPFTRHHNDNDDNSNNNTSDTRDVDDDVPVQLLLRGDTTRDVQLLTAALRAPVRDADAVLLQHQHAELTTLRARVCALQSQLHDSAAALQQQRRQCIAAQQRCEALARTHAAQLHSAYEAVQRDRDAVARALRAEVAARVRDAFDAGRRHERQRRQRRRQQQRDEAAHDDDVDNKGVVAPVVATRSATHA